MQRAKLRETCFKQTKAALQEAVTKDQLVIQAQQSLNDLHKITNNLAKRLREWAGGWLPEIDLLKDHEHATTLLANSSTEKILKKLERKDSVGTKLAGTDEAAIRELAKTLLGLYEEKARILEYIEETLGTIMPNTTALCGAAITAELLSNAGSLQRLARFPSGTIQLLGAETALFRHLKNKKNRPPKHGVIFNHQLLQRAHQKDRGKVARALADKITITVKVDFFKGDPCGERLRNELEAKFS